MNIQITSDSTTSNIIDFNNPGICTGYRGRIIHGGYGCEAVEEYYCKACDCWHIGNFKDKAFKADLKQVPVAEKDKAFIESRQFNVSIANVSGRRVSLGNYTLHAAESLIKRLATQSDKQLRQISMFPITEDERSSWFDLQDQQKIKKTYDNNLVILSPDRNHTIH